MIVSHLSKQETGLLAKHGQKLPTGYHGRMAMHIVARDSPFCLDKSTAAGTPYHRSLVVVEIQDLAVDEDAGRRAVAWALETMDEMLEADAALDTDYIPSTAPAKKVFSERY